MDEIWGSIDMTYVFECLRVLLQQLHRDGEPFLVLRYSPAYSPAEHELDLLVPRRSKQRLLRAVLSRLAPDISCISVKSGLLGLRVLLAGRARSLGPERLSVLVLDIRELIVKRDAVLASYTSVMGLGPARLEGGLPLPSERAEAGLLLSRNVWSKRTFSARHHDILGRTWTHEVLDILPRFLIVSRGSTYQDAFANAARLSVPRARSRAHALGRLRMVAEHVTLAALRMDRKSPTVIAIHGPDGTGKTTAAASVARTLGQLGVRVFAQHYTGAELTDEYLRGQQEMTAVAAVAHQAEPGLLRHQLGRALLFPARHVAFLHDIVRKRPHDVVVYDRFTFDHLFKGHALGMSSMARANLARLGRPLRIRSGVVNIMLVADAATTRGRKAELSSAQIVEYYRTAPLYFGRDLRTVDACLPPAMVADGVLAEFLQDSDRKLRARWGGA